MSDMRCIYDLPKWRQAIIWIKRWLGLDPMWNSMRRAVKKQGRGHWLKSMGGKPQRGPAKGISSANSLIQPN